MEGLMPGGQNQGGGKRAGIAIGAAAAALIALAVAAVRTERALRQW